VNQIIRQIEKEYEKPSVPDFDVGDAVDVHVKIVEGDKERIQVFSGVVIARKHSGIRATFTVRRIVQGEGVERVFPLHSPSIVDIKVGRKAKVRRSKLYYLRRLTGKAARLRERRGILVTDGTPESE
jgi:large subunit ribosomal protein L19